MLNFSKTFLVNSSVVLSLFLSTFSCFLIIFIIPKSHPSYTHLHHCKILCLFVFWGFFLRSSISCLSKHSSGSRYPIYEKTKAAPWLLQTFDERTKTRKTKSKSRIELIEIIVLVLIFLLFEVFSTALKSSHYQLVERRRPLIIWRTLVILRESAVRDSQLLRDRRKTDFKRIIV